MFTFPLLQRHFQENDIQGTMTTGDKWTQMHQTAIVYDPLGGLELVF